MDWNKQSDWLPMSNALEQVIFWKDDLQKAQNFFAMIIGMGVNESNPMYKIAQADIQVSKNGLEKAQAKLKETIKRIEG